MLAAAHANLAGGGAVTQAHAPCHEVTPGGSPARGRGPHGSDPRPPASPRLSPPDTRRGAATRVGGAPPPLGGRRPPRRAPAAGGGQGPRAVQVGVRAPVGNTGRATGGAPASAPPVRAPRP